ncbi:hypothetical protein PBY51_016827 [Eleginops maclovinus]|uniref:Uncharacterized protein n=1 Tax=Eleginops maclovinus TaxID=56733 RepID=A0AAN7WV13_ELEMC|nr:hypothetical protein PBY51_016827 [Eleginops maclovinus]
MGFICPWFRLRWRSAAPLNLFRGNTVTMKSGLSVAFLLLLVTGTVSVRGFSLYDALRGKGKPQTETAKPTAGGFNLGDALGPDPTPTKLAGGNPDSGFIIDHALRPADTPCAGVNQEIVQALKMIIENQETELRMLQQITPPRSRFYGKR